MHKAQHICPASPDSESQHLTLFISEIAVFFFFLSRASLFCFVSLPSLHSFVLLHLSSVDQLLLHLQIPLFVTIVRNRVQDFFPFVFIITQRALLAQHQDCHQRLLFHFLPVFLLFLFFLLLNDKYLCHFQAPLMNRRTAITRRGAVEVGGIVFIDTTCLS